MWGVNSFLGNNQKISDFILAVAWYRLQTADVPLPLGSRNIPAPQPQNFSNSLKSTIFQNRFTADWICLNYSIWRSLHKVNWINPSLTDLQNSPSVPPENIFPLFFHSMIGAAFAKQRRLYCCLLSCRYQAADIYFTVLKRVLLKYGYSVIFFPEFDCYRTVVNSPVTVTFHERC